MNDVYRSVRSERSERHCSRRTTLPSMPADRAQQTFVDRMGLAAETDGLSPIAGRLFATLLLATNHARSTSSPTRSTSARPASAPTRAGSSSAASSNASRTPAIDATTTSSRPTSSPPGHPQPRRALAPHSAARRRRCATNAQRSVRAVRARFDVHRRDPVRRRSPASSPRSTAGNAVCESRAGDAPRRSAAAPRSECSETHSWHSPY